MAKRKERNAIVDVVNNEPVVRLFEGERQVSVVPCRDSNDAREIGEYYILTGQVSQSI